MGNCISSIKISQSTVYPTNQRQVIQNQSPHKPTIKALQITSDYDQNITDYNHWYDGGEPFPKPDWTPTKISDLVCHQYGKTIAGYVTIDWPGTSPVNVTIKFAATGPCVDSGSGNTTLQPGDNRVDFTMTNACQSIQDTRYYAAWTIIHGAHHYSTKIEFRMIMVANEPYSVIDSKNRVTSKQLIHAASMVRNVNSIDPHQLVSGIHSKLPGYHPTSSFSNPWTFGDNLQQQIDCQSMARYIRCLIKALGVPGTAETVVVYASAYRPQMALESPLPERQDAVAHTQSPQVCFEDIYGRNQKSEKYSPKIYNKYNNISEELRLEEAALVDGEGTTNNYEGCFKFTFNGITKYYPGGVPSSLNNRIQVLQCFQGMAWIKDDKIKRRMHYNYKEKKLYIYNEKGVCINQIEIEMEDGGDIRSAKDLRDLIMKKKNV